MYLLVYHKNIIISGNSYTSTIVCDLMNHLERKEWRMKMEIIYLWWKLEVWWGFIRGVKENGPCICSFIKKLGVCLGSAWLASIGKHHLFLWPYVKTRVDHKCVEHPPLWTQHLETLEPWPLPGPPPFSSTLLFAFLSFTIDVFPLFSTLLPINNYIISTVFLFEISAFVNVVVSFPTEILSVLLIRGTMD